MHRLLKMRVFVRMNIIWMQRCTNYWPRDLANGAIFNDYVHRHFFNQSHYSMPPSR